MPAARGTSAVPWSFSPDGRWMAFHRNEPHTSYDLWAAPIDYTRGTLRLGAPQLLLSQPGIQAAPAISLDGRYLAYGSVESGRPEIYVIPFSLQNPPMAGKWRVSTDGGRSPKWSHDGGEIFFRSPDDHLMAAAVTTRANSFQTDKPRIWSAKRLSDIGALPNFDVAPDGKRVVGLVDVDDARPDETHLRILMNIDDEMRRQHLNLRYRELASPSLNWTPP